jgi:hypothetical protein
MLLTGATAVVVVSLGLACSAFLERFKAPMSPALLRAVGCSIVIMALHKAESFWFDEYDQCPVYVTAGASSWTANPRKAVFVSFVPTFIGMLALLFLALAGPPWHLVIVTIWMGQGLHEIHHSAKTLARRRIYPGLFTAILFVAVQSFWLFPLWHDLVIGSRGAFFYGYYALLPFIFLAFYIEDKSWIRQAPRDIWHPS